MSEVEGEGNTLSPSSCEFLSGRMFFLVSAGPLSRDLVVILWPSDPRERPLEDCLSLGREEARPALTHQDLFIRVAGI